MGFCVFSWPWDSGKGETAPWEVLRAILRNHRPLAGQRKTALSSARGCWRSFFPHLFMQQSRPHLETQCFVQSVCSAACAQSPYAKWSRESIFCVCIVYQLFVCALCIHYLCVHCVSIQVPALLGYMKAHRAILFSHPFSPCIPHISTT